MRNRIIFNKFILLTVIGLLIFIAVSRLPGRWTCKQWQFGMAVGAANYATPEKVVVKPWKGEHNVYSIFMIPQGHLNNPIFTVTIPGSGTFCGGLHYVGARNFQDVEVKPGYYLMKGLLRTRAALWLISQGKGSELKQAQFWKVGYSDMEEKATKQ